MRTAATLHRPLAAMGSDGPRFLRRIELQTFFQSGGYPDDQRFA